MGFSDDTGIYHADYISGWDDTFLQSVLNNCQTDSFAANPNSFCEDFLTFRDAPKCTDEATCDFGDPALLEKLRAIQPPPLDITGTVAPEETATVIGSLPRGTCIGELLPPLSDASPTRSPTTSSTASPTSSVDTASPTTSPISSVDSGPSSSQDGSGDVSPSASEDGSGNVSQSASEDGDVSPSASEDGAGEASTEDVDCPPWIRNFCEQNRRCRLVRFC